MCAQLNPAAPARPDPCEPLIGELRDALGRAVTFCTAGSRDLSFLDFERRLWPLLMAIGRLLHALFLTSRSHCLDLGPWASTGLYRCKDGQAERTLRTRCGPVRYRRAYLVRRH